MTVGNDEVTLATVSGRLDELTDLFRRRLLDDRAKQAVIEDLQARLDRAEAALSAASLKPLVDGLSLVIERLQASDQADEFRASITDELEYVLETVGVAAISAKPGEPVDRLRHRVTSATGNGPELRVAELIRSGYEKHGVVLRPATVTAVRATTDTSSFDDLAQ